MVSDRKWIRTFVLRLIVGLALLGWPRVGTAQGTWSVISLPPRAGEVVGPGAVAVDGAGNLYVADGGSSGRIQKRDGQGNWSVIATEGASALAADAAGSLYAAVAGRIQKRDAQGNWSVISTSGDGPAQDSYLGALAVDTAGNLYVAEYANSRIWKRDTQGKWSLIASQVGYPTGLAADQAGAISISRKGTPIGAS